jgi:hypothetical protein
MFSNVSTQDFLAKHRYYPNSRYPDIQMLVVQQMQVTIGIANVNDNTYLEVSRTINEFGSCYEVFEVSRNKCNGCSGRNVIASVGSLTEAMSACNAHIRTARGEPVQTLEEEEQEQTNIAYA